MCDPIAQDAVEYYAFSNKSEDYMSERIYANEEKDTPFALVEPYSGVGVSLLLRF